MKQLNYRPAALDRLTSPERFDEILLVSASKHWTALAGAFLLTFGAGLWSWFGTVNTTADGGAVLVRAGGLLSVNAPGSGQITEFTIKPRDKVRANQVIARISNPLLAEQVRLAEDALAEARREAERAVRLKAEAAELRIAANDRENANLQSEIAELEERTRFAAEVVSQKEKLFAAGLIIKFELVEAQHKAKEIQNQIAQRRARIDQLKAERFANASAPEDTRAAALEHVADLERRVATLHRELRESTAVISPYGGEVMEVKSYSGAIITVGSPVLTLQPSGRLLEALAYIPAGRAKLIRAGMDAELSPSTVRRLEFGYLKASVLSVSDYPLSPTALMRRFENESLTSSITSQGPVAEVRLSLIADQASISGYRWSSAAGPSVALSSGTLCEVRIVTRRQRPISLLLPMWKEGLGL